MEPLIVYGKPDCVDFLRSKALLDDLEVPFEWRDIIASPEDAARATAISGGTSSPIIVFADGSFQVEPSDAELAVKLGFPAPEAAADGEICDVA
jgi:glutaredoxin